MRNASTFGIAVLLAPLAAAAAEPAAVPGQVEEMYVFGKGQARQVHSLTAAQIEQLPPGTSGLKAIEKLPGVNFQSADPYGAYEWSTRITVRAFNQNQLGFTLDGIPLGDLSYANHNGLHISRAIASENISRVELAQGTGSLSTASTSNLGGTIGFTSAEPSESSGLVANLTTGSDDAERLHVRLDSGEIGGGGRGYVSYTDNETGKWKGEGDQAQQQVNFRFVQPAGAATLSAYYGYSDRQEIDYQDLSLEMIRRLGSDWDNYFPDWNRAVLAAQGTFSGGVTSLDDAYWNAAGLREDHLGYVRAELPFGDAVSVDVRAYLHENEGQGLWGTPYVATPGGVPLSVRTTEYDVDRDGIIASLSFTSGAHEVEAGIWYETNDFNQARRFYGEPSAVAPTRDFTEFQNGAFTTQWEYKFETETWHLHAQDTWQVTPAVRVNFGAKSFNVETDNATVTGPDLSGRIEADESFLPQAGVVYTLDAVHELFAGIARNARAFIGAATGASPFATTPAGFAAIRDSIDPETSTTFEGGWRFNGERFEGSLTGYYVDFEDRLLAIQQGPGIQGNPSVLANVGSVESRGIEAALIWRPLDNLTWFNSLSLSASEYADDFTSNSVLVPVEGKSVVDAPEELFRSEVAYDDGRWFVRADLNYTGERYYTYLNQGDVDDYTLLNLSAGYRFGAFWHLREVVAQFDVTNLADEEYVATIGSNGFTNSDPAGTSQTLLSGAPRQVFFSLKGSL